MAASNEKIREVVEAYIAGVVGGTTDDILALYADDATVEVADAQNTPSETARIRIDAATLRAVLVATAQSSSKAFL